jgi:hypothetical protein
MRQNRTLRSVVSIVALAFALAHLFEPKYRIDQTTVVLLVICVLPWVQPLIKTIELFGVKLGLQELQSKVAEALIVANYLFPKSK